MMHLGRAFARQRRPPLHRRAPRPLGRWTARQSAAECYRRPGGASVPTQLILPQRSSSMTTPRVAIVGLALESNRWSRPAGDSDFKCLEGNALLQEARAAAPAMPMEA